MLALALEAPDAHDLAAPDRQADVVESWAATRGSLTSQTRLPAIDLGVALGVDAIDLAPEHQLDETRLGHLVDRAAADVDARRGRR